MPTEDELHERIEAGRAAYERVEGPGTPELEGGADPGPTSAAARDRYRHATAVATCSLLVGDAAAAQPWFARATRHALDVGDLVVDNPAALAAEPAADEPGVASHYVDGLLSAGLSGVEEHLLDAATRTFQRIVAIEALSRPAAYAELQVLATAALDDEDVHWYADRLRDLAATDEHATTLRPGQSAPLATTCEAIVDGDGDRVREGLDGLVEAHRRTVDDDAGEPDDLLCRPAGALVVVARSNGLDVRTGGEYVPGALAELP